MKRFYPQEILLCPMEGTEDSKALVRGGKAGSGKGAGKRGRVREWIVTGTKLSVVSSALDPVPPAKLSTACGHPNSTKTLVFERKSTGKERTRRR